VATHYYFAYGSNMNEQRMRQRGMQFSTMQAAVLKDFSLHFNKPCSREGRQGVAHANVVHEPGGSVEGVLYRLDSTWEIERMDPFEETPNYYRREILSVETREETLPAWVYIGVDSILIPGLRPRRDYLYHILQGKAFLSPDYFSRLESVECW